MIYKLQRILADVRIAIDENKKGEQLLSTEDIDTLSLEEIIRSKIEESVRRVLTVAPFDKLDGGKPFGDSIFWRTKGSGWTKLPENFMRLVIFKMSDWERPVYSAISVYDPMYKMQSSRYKGIRGNPQKPVVAIVRRAEGLILELYSCKSEEATVEQALYLPLPKFDMFEGIWIPRKCYRSVVYMAASLVCATIGRFDLSNMMMELSKQLLL